MRRILLLTVVFALATGCGAGRQDLDAGAPATTTATSSDNVDSLRPATGRPVPASKKFERPLSQESLGFLDCGELTDQLTRGQGADPNDRPFAVTDPPAGTTGHCWVGLPDGPDRRPPEIDYAGIIYIPDNLDPDVASLRDVTDGGGLMVSVMFNSRPPPFPPESWDGDSHRRVDVPGAVDDQGNPGQAIVAQGDPGLAEVIWNVRGGRHGVEQIELQGDYRPSVMLRWARSAFRTRDGRNPG
jgi:hypothetical protein